MNIKLLILVLLSPLGGICQTAQVTWSWKAVRVDSNHFELHLSANIFRGWTMYGVGKESVCPYVTQIIFDSQYKVLPIGKPDVIEGIECDTAEFPVKKYRNSVTFVQPFKMNIDSTGRVCGKIRWWALNQYMIIGPEELFFNLYVGNGDTDRELIRFPSSRVTHPKVATIYPKGPFRKAWWWIRHPFGPNYIDRYYLK